jgi:parallel beta-helix repeat protein
VIGPLQVNNTAGDAVYVDGTNLTKSFVLFNLTVAGNATPGARGIVLANVNASGVQTIAASVTGTGTSVQTNDVGIVVLNSSWVTLDGGGANPKGPGVAATGAGTINKNASGAIDVENSSHVTVRGFQMSANGVDGSPDWVSLDPGLPHWGVGGVRFFGVTDSTIDHNAANNCTSVSYSLFASNGNTLSNNTADYPFTMNFLITDGSSYNTVTGNVASTGDFIGLMIADPLPGTPTLAAFGASHDNVVVGNVLHGDGPTGNEVKAGVVPAFLGGLVVLNGTYDNLIAGNQLWSNVPADLVWAQAVPAATPIGVLDAPPAVSCNVTVSEGGGGVANSNGNVWTGNTVRTVVPCITQQ